MAFARPEPPLRSSREDDPELELRIDVFVLQLGETVDALQDAEASGRLQALGSLADALVGRCSELGYESLAEVAGQITAACREQNPVAAHKAVVDFTELSKRRWRFIWTWNVAVMAKVNRRSGQRHLMTNLAQARKKEL